MNAEIEAKLKVDSLEKLEEQLSSLGAEFVERQRHLDYYFDDERSTFAKNDKCLRLRLQSTADEKKIFLTYKGPKEKDNFKKRVEAEIEVDDIKSAESLLSVLGYKKKLVIEKNRNLWKLGPCLIALDSLPTLGSFVEIEGPDDLEITEVQKKIGLQNLQHIPESYAELMTKKAEHQIEGKLNETR